MATVYLGRTEDEFWNDSPRRIIAMIDAWKEIEHGRAKMQAYFVAMANNGHDIPDFPKKSKPVNIHPFYIG